MLLERLGKPDRQPRTRCRGWTLLFWLLALCAWADPAAADVGVFRGTSLGADAHADAAFRNVTESLQRLGVDHRVHDDAALTDVGLRAFDVVVLPYNRLSEGQVEALRRFAARGGRWVAYLTHSGAPSPALDALLGVRPAALVMGFAPRALVPLTRPGLPARVVVAPNTPHRPCTAQDPGLVAGQWEAGMGLAALVRGPHGYFVNMLPGSDPPHAELLLGLLGELDPPLWLEAAEVTRNRALDRLRSVSDRWARLRGEPEFSREQRARMDAALQAARQRVPGGNHPSPEIEPERAVLSERVRAALAAGDEAARLSPRLTPSRKGEIRGARIATTARADWDGLMRRAREAGMNAVFVRVGRGGSVLYPGAPVPQVAWAAGGDELKSALEAARRQSLDIHAWRVLFDTGDTPPDLRERLRAEDRLVRDPQGRQGPWLNPADPRNQDMELQVLLDLARRYDLDGIHLDGLQYPQDPHLDWDYGPVSLREFEKASKKKVERWPEDVISGARKQEYEDWERESLARLLQRIRADLRKLKPHLQLSASLAGDHRAARARLKQDWPLWVEQGSLDFVVPLADAADPDGVAAQVDGQVAVAAGRVQVAVGIRNGDLRDAEDALRCVDAARAGGADGFVLADLGAAGVEAHLSALRGGATAEGTWPAYQAPPAGWTLKGGVDRRDQPIAFVYGDRGELELRLPRSPQGRSAVKSLTALLRLEDLSGRYLSGLDTLNGWGDRKVRFEVPAGRFRPVLRGTIALADGGVRPFVVRGPVCEGLSGEDIALLRAQEAPPVVSGSGRKVAVYAGGAGATDLLQALRGAPGTLVFPLYRLQPNHLAAADVVVLAELSDLQELTPAGSQALRQWVSGGGTLVLLGDAVGLRWHPRLFPEVGHGVGTAPAAGVVAARAAGALAAGKALAVSGGEQVLLSPAQGAEVLLRQAGEAGEPVALAGKVGKGRVILHGVCRDSRALSEDEAAWLRAVIEGG